MVHPDTQLWPQDISKKLHKAPNSLTVVLVGRGKDQRWYFCQEKSMESEHCV